MPDQHCSNSPATISKNCDRALSLTILDFNAYRDVWKRSTAQAVFHAG
jgi:hypothetical protein